MDALNACIPQPCKEDWNNMLPDAAGKYCLLCSKTVTDFTNWELPAIEAYLKANAGQKICGRVTERQLHLTSSKDTIIQTIFRSRLSVFRKVAAAIIILFGLSASSCNKEMLETAERILNGGPLVEPMIVGEMVAMPVDTTVVAPAIPPTDDKSTPSL